MIRAARSVVHPLVGDSESIYRRENPFQRAAVTRRLVEGGEAEWPIPGLLISWGEIYPGREEQALRLWNETREYYGSLLEADRISRFEPFLVAGRGAPLHGFMVVGGTLEQIGALTLDDEWVRYIMRLEFCCKDVCVNPLNFGERLDHIMELWEHEVSALA